MRRKYHKTGTVILCILAASVVCVLMIIIFIYQSGIRYMRTPETGIKYFGRVDNNGYITYGRMWFGSTVASISLQRHYVVEINDGSLLPALNFRAAPADNVLYIINNNIPEDIRSGFPLEHFIFNQEDDRVLFQRETFEEIIRRYERERNNIISGEIYTVDGRHWTLFAENSNPSSFRNFEVIPASDRTRAFRGDLMTFLESEMITFASFTLSGGGTINLYPAHNIYRISFDRGVNAGDLYIGGINRNLQRHGRGIYFYAGGDIYYGDFVRDEKTGTGKILFMHGGSYSGGILNGGKEGEGTFIWNDGNKYIGSFVNNMKNGHGVYLFADGSVYEGDWVDGVRHGHGVFLFPTGDVFEGSFENDAFSGHGRYTWASGDYFEGNFVNNSIHGWGTYRWVTGRRYEGWFSFGEMVLEPPDGFYD